MDDEVDSQWSAVDAYVDVCHECGFSWQGKTGDDGREVFIVTPFLSNKENRENSTDGHA